jgi:hypothetical protein
MLFVLLGPVFREHPRLVTLAAVLLLLVRERGEGNIFVTDRRRDGDARRGDRVGLVGWLRRGDTEVLVAMLAVNQVSGEPLRDLAAVPAVRTGNV